MTAQEARLLTESNYYRISERKAELLKQEMKEWYHVIKICCENGENHYRIPKTCKINEMVIEQFKDDGYTVVLPNFDNAYYQLEIRW